MSMRHLEGWSRWKTDGGRRPEQSDIENKEGGVRTEDASISMLL